MKRFSHILVLCLTVVILVSLNVIAVDIDWEESIAPGNSESKYIHAGIPTGSPAYASIDTRDINGPAAQILADVQIHIDGTIWDYIQVDGAKVFKYNTWSSVPWSEEPDTDEIIFHITGGENITGFAHFDFETP